MTMRLTSILTMTAASCLALAACTDDAGTTSGDGADDVDTGTEESTEDTTDDEVGTTADTTETETDTETDTTGTETDTTGTETETGTETDTIGTETDTTEGETGEPVCGNGALEGDEACDDGNDSNSDSCLADCTEASCGDAFVQDGVEVCDDGVNDGAYGGCTEGCGELAAYCGDGELNGPEDCDDSNMDVADGCMDNCEIPSSCLDILDYDDTAMDGAYFVAPEGYDGDAFEVHCDMLTDGGGYTFYKVDPGGQTFAADAETECAMWGMQLWVPRSLEHKNSGWAIANDADIGGDASPNFMRILGIYPDQNGATCSVQPMNSDNPNCNWGPNDDGPWYVHEVSNIGEPNGDNNVTGSMFYSWQMNGDIQHHNDIAGNGYSSDRIMCDVGDKTP